MKTDIVYIKKLNSDFVISSDGELFEKEDGSIRKFKSQTGAILFLQSVCKKYPTIVYQATLPSGEIRQIGEATTPKPESERRPHQWSKANLTTLHSGGSSYDVYRCRFCGREEKAYGLNGHARKSGDCPKAPAPENS